MLDSEIRSASWKFGLVFLIVLVAFTQVPTHYDEIVRIARMDQQFMAEESQRLQEEGLSEKEVQEMYAPLPNTVDSAMNELSGVYTYMGTAAMVLLGGLLGIGLVSSEVGGGTILTLLARPVSRRRVFLTKYLTCATFLLVAAVLGAVGLFGVAWVRDYPFEVVTWGGVVLAVFLTWMISLFALGVAMLVSTLTRNVMQSLLITAVVIFVIISSPTFVSDAISMVFSEGSSYQQSREIYRITDSLTITNYWPDGNYFWPNEYFYNFADPVVLGGASRADFIVCLVGAIVPASVAFWLFGRKSF